LIEDDVDAKYDAMGTEVQSIAKKSATWNALLHHIAQHRHPQDHRNMTEDGCHFNKANKKQTKTKMCFLNCLLFVFIQDKDPGAAPKSVADLEHTIANIFALSRKAENDRFNHKVLWCSCCVVSLSVILDWQRAFGVSRFSFRELGGDSVSRSAAARRRHQARSPKNRLWMAGAQNKQKTRCFFCSQMFVTRVPECILDRNGRPVRTTVSPVRTDTAAC
jgi:ribosomal protein S14